MDRPARPLAGVEAGVEAGDLAVEVDKLRRRLERERRARQEAESIAEAATRKLYETVQALQRSNGELEHFAFIASHDLQEPLRKVTAFGSRLADGHGGQLDERGRDYLARMTAAAARMRTLIEDLLAYSRVSTRGRAFGDVDLNAVLAEVLADLEGPLEDAGGRVEAESLPTVRGDPVQLHQLLQNLVGNAIKYRRDGVAPVVRVGGGRAGPAAWRITVADNGIGFDPAQAERIFLPFQRLHGHSSNYKGSGIGLAICRKIVERHGGRVTAEGRPGEGSTFYVELAVDPPAPSPGEEPGVAEAVEVVP